MGTRQAEQQKPLCLLRRVVAPQPLVDRLEKAALPPPDPVHYGVEVVSLCPWPLTADELKQDSTKAVDIGLASGLASVEALGGNVANGSRDAVEVLISVGGALVVDGTGEAEVAEPSVEVGVQHDVAGLEVTVDHLLVVLVVEVMQR
ncbi:LOW QUALITY PROTEIN: hypothetical protein TorRG33x02_067100 [Trema orientale]|uniref:Uncharacterized protein n=1 Tax=Trema orientale TaxID=63057 RepID=A0A2P5FI85_TREOI|nr:LOW QUALITY PROTEIN: hypothetical protein TorRG33x02_067100 [Trema orientale]